MTTISPEDFNAMLGGIDKFIPNAEGERVQQYFFTSALGLERVYAIGEAGIKTIKWSLTRSDDGGRTVAERHTLLNGTFRPASVPAWVAAAGHNRAMPEGTHRFISGNIDTYSRVGQLTEYDQFSDGEQMILGLLGDAMMLTRPLQRYDVRLGRLTVVPLDEALQPIIGDDEDMTIARSAVRGFAEELLPESWFEKLLAGVDLDVACAARPGQEEPHLGRTGDMRFNRALGRWGSPTGAIRRPQ